MKKHVNEQEHVIYDWAGNLMFNGRRFDTFEEAKTLKQEIDNRVDAASKALQAFPKGPMGMVPAEIKATQEYRIARHEYDSSFESLRHFNEYYVRTFKKEIREDRKNKYKKL